MSNRKTVTAVGVVAAMVGLTIAPVALAQQTEGVTTVLAQRRAAALAARASRAVAPRASVRGVQVVGVAWTAEYTPVHDPRLRLRNALSGLVAAMTVGNQQGEFAFDEVDGGTYVVELVDAEDRLQAVGEVLTVVGGEIVATFVMLSQVAPAVPALLGQAATAAAAGVGVAAVTNVGYGASGES